MSHAGTDRGVGGPSTAERIVRFALALKRVGGDVTVAANEREAVEVVRRVLKGWGQPSHRGGVAVSDSTLARSVLLECCADIPAAFDVPVDGLFQYEVGVTGAQYGVAETGTLVLDAGSERHRLLSLVPPKHLVLLEASRLRDTVADVLTELNAPGRRVSPTITFVTGPSRTSDIELTPVVGVHGPGSLHVILIQDDA